HPKAPLDSIDCCWLHYVGRPCSYPGSCQPAASNSPVDLLAECVSEPAELFHLLDAGDAAGGVVVHFAESPPSTVAVSRRVGCTRRCTNPTRSASSLGDVVQRVGGVRIDGCSCNELPASRSLADRLRPMAVDPAGGAPLRGLPRKIRGHVRARSRPAD